ncbi:hypothetical protein QWY28_09145 [Nocardioides sp. SOB77]|uniref:Secreted protein n=1 Tax=Nocardioides oceani TaxID=3058369 RepID=A0ABT8FF59_9ACTN|nr:hypothetical protein [Nocardioides oceani]MDN4173105.1 hypothetical protein [Nocardioides oceani]
MKLIRPLGAAVGLSTAALSLTVVASPASTAAPQNVPTTTTSTVTGEILHARAVDLGGLLTAAEVGLGPVRGTVGATDPRVTARAANLDAALLGQDLPGLLASASQTAPPDHPTPATASIVPTSSIPGVLTLGCRRPPPRLASARAASASRASPTCPARA